MRRSLLLWGIVAAVVLAAGIAVFYFLPEDEPEPIKPPVVTPGVRTDLINEPQDNVLEIRFEPSGCVPYILKRDLSGSREELELVLESPDALFPGRPAVMRIIFTYATTLRNLQRVTASADDAQLVLFGFDKPVMTWRVERIDGTTIELETGSRQATGEAHYVREKNSREVFLLSELQSIYLTLEMEELYDLSFFPYLPSTAEDDTWFFINHLILERHDDTIELYKRSEDTNTDAQANASVYRIVQPLIGDCNDYIVQTVILEPVTRIAPDRIEDASPVDLSVYGLDSPYKLTITTDDWNGTLLIGGRNPEHGGRYVKFDGINIVLVDYDGDYTFLDTDPTLLRTRLIWMHSIDKVSSVTYELDGETRVLELEHGPEGSLTGRLDGKDLSEVNARRLFMYTLGISQTGSTNFNTPIAEPDYRITMQFMDGSNDIIELYNLSDAQFLIVHNGVNTGFYITRMTLQQSLLNRFETLDRGEDLLIY